MGFIIQYWTSEKTKWMNEWMNEWITKTGLPVGEPAGVLGVIAAGIATIEVAQIVDRVAFQAEPSALFSRQSGQHLVEYVVVLLLIQRTYHARLIQKVAVDLGPVQCPVRHLHFDEMTLPPKKKINK